MKNSVQRMVWHTWPRLAFRTMIVVTWIAWTVYLGIFLRSPLYITFVCSMLAGWNAWDLWKYFKEGWL